MKDIIKIKELKDGSADVEGKWALFVRVTENSDGDKVSLLEQTNMGWGSVPNNAKVGQVLAEGEECALLKSELHFMLDENGNYRYSDNPRVINGVKIPMYYYRIKSINDNNTQSDRAAQILSKLTDSTPAAQDDKAVLADAQGVS